MNTERIDPVRSTPSARQEPRRSGATGDARTGRRLVAVAPESRAAILRGVDLMAAIVRPTLGPMARTVVVAGQSSRSAPEVLDHAATIMRRTIQIADPFADMGAMLIRQLAWSVFARVGDGAATAVTLAQAILHAAASPVAAGADPMALRRGIERGLSVAISDLRRQACPIESAAEVAHIIAGVARDPEVAARVGEVVEAVGPDGAVLIEDWKGVTTHTEYIDGLRWNGGLFSPYLLGAGETEGHLHEPAIFVTDCPIVSANDLLPVLEACVSAGKRQLLVIAAEMSDAAIGLLILNRERGVLDGVLAVRAPEQGDLRARILEDIAIATGGRAFLTAAGANLTTVTADDFGSARQVWARADGFSILGGRGDKAAVRRRISEAKAELRAITDDDTARTRVRERIGKLAGTAAIFYVGAPTDSARAELRVRIEAAVLAAQAALREGAVAGGGGALLACVSAVERLADDLSGDEALGTRLLARALSAPMRAIAENAGIEASALFASGHRDHRTTFDVLHRAWIDAWEGGILDPFSVVQAALEGGVSTAIMALTTEVLVRHKRPQRATNP